VNTIQKNQINNSLQKELLGGTNKEWKNIVEKISQKKIKHTLHGDIMRNLAYELKNIKRTEFPIFLDPTKASFVDVGIHAKIRQYLSDSAIEKNLRYACFMEKHPCPVNFRDLTPEDFLRHIELQIRTRKPPSDTKCIKT